mmetsp:Transcript_31457/g.83815  ORF Transcript_31457/g.83815 Transcript_31457/m.83815 type:complete len:340 (+) Transcript_31457:181-1200(+)
MRLVYVRQQQRTCLLETSLHCHRSRSNFAEGAAQGADVLHAGGLSLAYGLGFVPHVIKVRAGVPQGALRIRQFLLCNFQGLHRVIETVLQHFQRSDSLAKTIGGLVPVTLHPRHFVAHPVHSILQVLQLGLCALHLRVGAGKFLLHQIKVRLRLLHVLAQTANVSDGVAERGPLLLQRVPRCVALRLHAVYLQVRVLQAVTEALDVGNQTFLRGLLQLARAGSHPSKVVTKALHGRVHHLLTFPERGGKLVRLLMGGPQTLQVAVGVVEIPPRGLEAHVGGRESVLKCVHCVVRVAQSVPQTLDVVVGVAQGPRLVSQLVLELPYLFLQVLADGHRLRV